MKSVEREIYYRMAIEIVGLLNRFSKHRLQDDLDLAKARASQMRDQIFKNQIESTTPEESKECG